MGEGAQLISRPSVWLPGERENALRWLAGIETAVGRLASYSDMAERFVGEASEAALWQSLTDIERQVAMQVAILTKAVRDLRMRLEAIGAEWFQVPVRDIEHQLANLVLYNVGALRFGVQMAAANQHRVDDPERLHLAQRARDRANFLEQRHPYLKRRQLARMVAQEVYGSETHYKTVERARLLK